MAKPQTFSQMIIIAPSSPQFIKWMARKPISPNRMPKVLCGRAPNSTHKKSLVWFFDLPTLSLFKCDEYFMTLLSSCLTSGCMEKRRGKCWNPKKKVWKALLLYYYRKERGAQEVLRRRLWPQLERELSSLGLMIWFILQPCIGDPRDDLMRRLWRIRLSAMRHSLVTH